ncbi:MAG: methionyl-tRNA formyltransferase, partial [Bacteroidota bacterium]|nr:methionyl-tRNA formyltransferase [Bacteroidota bacterium]
QIEVSGGEAGIKHAPKIFTETCRIDWNRPVAEIYDLIRGLSPFPGAFTQLDGKVLKVYRSEKEPGIPSVPAGQLVTDKKTFLKFAAADGMIRLEEVQLEGKRKMKIEDFLRGYR